MNDDIVTKREPGYESSQLTEWICHEKIKLTN